MEQAVEVYGLTPLQSWLLVIGLAYLGWRLLEWYMSRR